jgi:hypothetical protein
VLLDRAIGSAELERLAETLQPPCRLDEFSLEGLLSRTTTALVFVARDSNGAQCVLKLTGPVYTPVLQRELDLLNACRAAGVRGVVRPLRDQLLLMQSDGSTLAAEVLPFLTGGDLVVWIGAHATRTGRLGATPALRVSAVVGNLLRELLRLPRPIVHGDVKPQNLLLPRPDAALSELTLIDLDAATELEAPVAAPPREIAQQLVADVNGFGELLYMVATGREPPSDEEPNPSTGNAIFDELVVRCITAEAGSRGYASMAGDGLWRDLDQAIAAQHQRSRTARVRPLLGLAAVVLFFLLLLMAARVAIP